jgi:glycosylphosphatidylinositol phospholipase D
VVFGRTTGFPAVFELRRLRRVAGGDGSEGFLLKGFVDHGAAGRAVSDAGDVNGDGIDDLLVSAYSAGSDIQGQAYVLFGRTSGFPAEFALRTLLPQQGGDGSEGFVMQGIEPRGNVGRSVSGAGDVNGDGLDDVIIGSSNAQENAGESYVVFGRSTGFPAFFPLRDLLPQQGGDGSKGFILRGAETFDFAGYSVSGAGDVNGDGADDLLIGAYGVDPHDIDNAGASYLVFGSTTGFPPLVVLPDIDPVFGVDGSAGVVFAGGNEFDRAGKSVSGAGDVNGDGIEDLMISAYGADPGGTEDAGETYIVFGRRTGFPAVFPLQSLSPGQGGDGSEGFIVAGARIDDVTGKSVSDAGDVNGDGVDDFIIGAPWVDPAGRTDAGASFIVFGRR